MQALKSLETGGTGASRVDNPDGALHMVFPHKGDSQALAGFHQCLHEQLWILLTRGRKYLFVRTACGELHLPASKSPGQRLLLVVVDKALVVATEMLLRNGVSYLNKQKQ